MVATSWLVYRLASDQSQNPEYNPAFVLGVVGFAGQIPQLILAPLAGVWVDRIPRRALLIGTQFLSMLQSIGLAVLALTNTITIPHVIFLNVFQGIVNAFDMPARQAFVVEMVESREDLPNAIALSSSMVHAARLIGPAIGGYLIYRFGESSCFIVDAVSYLGVLIALLFIKVKASKKPISKANVFVEMKEGHDYAWNFKPIRFLLLLTSATSIFFISLTTVLPIFAAQILGGGERVYGLLMAASGLGALIGAIWLAARKSVLGLSRVIAYANIGLGLMLLLFGFSQNLSFSLSVLVISGFCMVAQLASSNTVLQTIVDHDKRGRVMSLFGMAFLGMAPIGSLLAGLMAEQIGAPLTISSCGAAIMICGFFFTRQLPMLRDHIRPLYEKLGIYR